MYKDIGSGYYYFQYFLDTAVDGDFTISQGYGISADMSYDRSCDTSEETISSSSSSVVQKGQYGYANVTTGTSIYYGFSSYRLQNIIFIDGIGGLQHGDTFVKGVTTVTVNIQSNCGTL
jgi:hypothetical protein